MKCRITIYELFLSFFFFFYGCALVPLLDRNFLLLFFQHLTILSKCYWLKIFINSKQFYGQKM